MRIEKTVLLIDDDEDDLAMLEEALKTVDGGYNIINAQDGVVGLEKLNRLLKDGKLPCLVILDINMPKMDGKETFAAIKSDSRLSTIPIVIFSTSTSLLDKIFFERYKTAYLVKPINFTDLARTASRMMAICKQQSASK